jgi:hypothetical protein
MPATWRAAATGGQGPAPSPALPPPAPARRTRRTRGRAIWIAVCAAVAVISLVTAVGSGARAHAQATRKPTPAELSAAAAIGVTQRWERLAAGQIFPAGIGYSTDLGTRETATRLGISPSAVCSTSVDGTLTALASRFGCRAGVRASYADGLQGAVYTVGVLAFPNTRAAASFYDQMPGGSFPATGLRAFAVAGTAAARFGEAARQSATAQLTGPYVVLVVAGYSDGRAAAATGERRDSVFTPETTFASAVAAVLARPQAVNCGSAEWSC